MNETCYVCSLHSAFEILTFAITFLSIFETGRGENANRHGFKTIMSDLEMGLPYLKDFHNWLR